MTGAYIRCAAAAAGILLAAACSKGDRARACEPGGEDKVVACYQHAPIDAAEVAQFLRPAAPVPGKAALPDPRQAALDAAVRTRVLAAEAVRRGLGSNAGSLERQRAVAYQALRRKVAEDANATPGDVGDDEARRFYDANPGVFNKITETYCRVITVADAARAEKLYAELGGADDDAFAAAGGVDIGEAHQPGVDPAIRATANDLRHAGDIGGPIAVDAGGYAIVRATRVEMTVKPFEEVAAQVKNHIAHQREEVALDALYDQLRPRVEVEVFADQLAAVPMPTPATE